MTDFEDPPRWADAPGSVDPRLTSLFRAAREDVASDRELEALAAQLGPALGPGASASMSLKASLLAKLGVGVALVVLGAAGVYYAHTRAQRQASSAGPPARVTASPSAQAGAAVAAPSADQPANPVEATPAPAVSSAPGARAGNRLPSVGAHEGSVAPDEATLLESARAELAANPARALALTSEHAQLFPHGVLAQEREVIAIAALRRLGRTAAAERRAEAFDRSYPHSAHQHTVDAEPAK